MRQIFPDYALIPVWSNDYNFQQWKTVSLDLNVDKSISLDWVSIQKFNTETNLSIAYKPDQSWGIADDWQTPKTTIERGSGDCEDYAIYKYAVLLNSGVPVDNLAIILGQIASLAGNTTHAFLVVEIDGEQKVLDNKFHQLINPTDYINWIPQKMLQGNEAFLFSRPITISGG